LFGCPTVGITKRADLTSKILDIKREKGWTWKYICSEIGGYSPILITAALLREMKLTKPQAAAAGRLFGLTNTEQPTRAGSATRAQAPLAGLDAQVVARLRAAGAIMLGKAHTTEFAYFDGPPPTRNPWNLAHTPGGSSSGPAAAVAAGMVPLSLGTQTAGSVSRPAAYCGIAAFKPSTRAWSSFGVVPFSPTFDTIGLFGYRVRDAVAAARVLMPTFLARTCAPPASDRRLNIGLIEDPIAQNASTLVVESFKTVCSKLQDLGAVVTWRRSPTRFNEMNMWHKTVTEYELAHVHPQLATLEPVSPALRDAVHRGQALGRTSYEQAYRAIEAAQQQFWGAMHNVDALVFPAAPDVAPPGVKTGDPSFIIPFTALGGPIVSVPVAIAPSGLPIGLMLTGAPGTDWSIAAVAERLANAIELSR
jgi:aspartyl-tRNA(Asn)/glutamyl-tRNA(Gln) amidotransferase subunit A